MNYVSNKYLFASLLLIMFVGTVSTAFSQTEQQLEQLRTNLPRDLRIQNNPMVNSRNNDFRKPGTSLADYDLSANEKRLVAPSDVVKAKNADFLRLPNTGIVKLIGAECQSVSKNHIENGQSDKQTEIKTKCNKSFSDAGRSYSFRHHRYLPFSMSDVRLGSDKFVTTGFLTQGIIVALSETNINEVSLTSPGVVYLNEFAPATTAEETENQRKEIEAGILKGEFVYSKSAPIKPNAIYALRSIAYRSKYKTLDRREDTIVVFQVVEREQNGNTTIIWRRLRSEKAPEIRIY